MYSTIKPFIFSISALVFLLVSSTMLSAQTAKTPVPTTIQHRNELMSLGSRPAYTMRFIQTSDVKVEDIWKDFAKKNFSAKLKKNKKTNETVGMQSIATPIHTDRFDLYSKVEKSGTDAVFTVWFDLGVNFLNPTNNAKGAEEVERYLRAFDLEVRKSIAEDAVKAEEKNLEKINDETKKLEKKNETARKEIESLKEKIAKLEQEVKDNEVEQARKKEETEAQQKVLDAARKFADDLR